MSPWLTLKISNSYLIPSVISIRLAYLIYYHIQSSYYIDILQCMSLISINLNSKFNIFGATIWKEHYLVSIRNSAAVFGWDAQNELFQKHFYISQQTENSNNICLSDSGSYTVFNICMYMCICYCMFCAYECIFFFMHLVMLILHISLSRKHGVYFS